MRNLLTIASALAALAFVGCSAGSPPTAHLKYVFAPDLPVPAGSRQVRLFPVKSEHQEFALGQLVRDVLQQELEAAGYEVILPEPATTQPATAGAPVAEAAGDIGIDCHVHFEQGQTQGSRTIRIMDNSSLTQVQAPTLVRRARMLLEIRLVELPSRKELARAQANNQYNSLSDPRVQGPGGLGRNDDPQHVPPADQVLRELAQWCVRNVMGMMKPVLFEEGVQFKPMAGSAGQEALAAAGRGEYALAADLLKAARQSSPTQPELLFNLALAYEAAGELEKARLAYCQAIAATDRKDLQAVQGLRRVERAIANSWK